MIVNAGFGAGIFLLNIFISLIFLVIVVIIAYFIIKIAVKNAIKESEIDVRLAVKRGILEAHRELDVLKSSKEKSDM